MDPNRVRRGMRSSPLIERDVVVGEPDVLGVEVAGHVRFDHRLELKGQRISDRFLCHAVTVTRIHRFREIGRRRVAR